jgi:hypothetical protein
MGALLWTVAVVDMTAHVVTGDWIAPVVAVIVAVSVVAVRQVRRSALAHA